MLKHILYDHGLCGHDCGLCGHNRGLWGNDFRLCGHDRGVWVTIMATAVKIVVCGQDCGFQSHDRGLCGHNHCLWGHYHSLCGHNCGLCGQNFFQTEFWIQYLSSSWNLLSNDMLQCIFCQWYAIFTAWKEILFASDITCHSYLRAAKKSYHLWGFLPHLIFLTHARL